MRATGTRVALAFATLAWAGCAGAPSYPEPQGAHGQILVRLEGEPKRGLGSRRRDRNVDDYDGSPASAEEGRAFERVDYRHLPDVVVVADPGRALPKDRAGSAADATVELDADGFDRVQLLAAPGAGNGPASFTVRNRRGGAVVIYGFNENDDSFEATVPANGSSTVQVSAPGRYDVSCDEDDALHLVLFVTDRPAWIGPSDADAFFGGLPPQEYTVTVYPPRLPTWSRKVTVTPGKRTNLLARLTVNTLPRAGK
jgi:hypothetical protein